MSYRDERISFRFFELTEEEAKRISECIPGARVKPQRGEPSKYIVSSDLSPEDDLSWIETLIQQYSLSEKQYGFFLSLATGYDRGIITIPDFIRALFRRIGGQLDFSFTASGGYIDGVYDPINKAARSVGLKS